MKIRKVEPVYKPKYTHNQKKKEPVKTKSRQTKKL